MWDKILVVTHDDDIFLFKRISRDGIAEIEASLVSVNVGVNMSAIQLQILDLSPLQVELIKQCRTFWGNTISVM